VTVRRLASPGALPHGERFVLLLDDVDTLDTTAQIAAFEAAHAARAAGGAVLAAGPAPARELALREDLRSRLAQCVNLPLAALSEEEARAALEAQAAALGFPLDRALSDYLMQRARRDMGTLSSLLAALDRRSLSLQRPLTVALVREVLRDNERMSPSGSTAS
jgi:DnaA family protein